VTDTDVPAGPGEGDDGGDVGSSASPWWRRWWVWAAAAAAAVVLVAVGVIVWAVQDDDNGEDTAPSTTTTTTTEPTTTTTSTTTTTPPTTTTEATTTIEAVAAWIQQQFNDRYAQSTPAPQVTGPTEIICTDTGPVAVGGVFGCHTHTPTEPPDQLEEAGVIVYVLDTTGRAAYNAATDIPDSTESLMEGYQAAPKGLYCRDLLNPDFDPYPFSQGPTPSAHGFFWSLVYWSLEGEPDRMDADLNGIPCETLYAPDVVAQVLEGGVLGG